MSNSKRVSQLFSGLAMAAFGLLLVAAPCPAQDPKPATQPVVRFDGVHAELAVGSVAKAIAFYHDNLGFTVEFQYGSPAFYAILARDSVRFAVVAHDTDYEFPSNLYISVNDVQKLYDQLKDRAPLSGPPVKQPWGSTEFVLVDPDGNRLRFAQGTR